MTSETNPSFSCTEASGSQSLKGGVVMTGEYVDTGSTLIDETISKVEFYGRKYGNPTGNALLGVWNSSGTLVHTYGTVDVSTLTTSNAWISAESTTGYELSAGDTVGIFHSTGTNSDHISLQHDDSNPLFDGSNSVWTRMASDNSFAFWTNVDMTFKFYKELTSTQHKVTVYFFEDNTTESDAHWRTPSTGGGGGSSSATWRWWQGMRYGTRKRYGTSHIRRMRI